MAKIMLNKKIANNIFKLKIKGSFKGKRGQFYMLKTSQTSQPFLLRPISINDIAKDYITFVYEVKGKGTILLSQLKEKDELNLLGPLGNGFEIKEANYTLIGGGLGIAPLYLLAKEIKEVYPKANVDVYLGFSFEEYLVEEFEGLNVNVNVNIGGKITDIVDFEKDDIFITCGPEVMMRAVYNKAKDKEVYVSLEKRMACGVGACLGCSIETTLGMKKVCKDGPVFLANEVFYE